MYKYELRPSRVEWYPYLCMPVSNLGFEPHDNVRRYCLEMFGEEGTKGVGRWYDGLLGFYFKNQDDAVQFILTWG